MIETSLYPCTLERLWCQGTASYRQSRKADRPPKDANSDLEHTGNGRLSQAMGLKVLTSFLSRALGNKRCDFMRRWWRNEPQRQCYAPAVTQLLCSACKNDGSSMRIQTNLLNHPIQSYYLYWTSEATNSSADLSMTTKPGHDSKTLILGLYGD